MTLAGAGKAYAFAFALREDDPKKVLFLIHREQIAKQTIKSYKKVFRATNAFGLLFGNEKDYSADYLFSTMQMMSKDETLLDLKRDSYVCIDKMYYPEKPFLVLEIADEIEGPYEDADPFPYDLSMDELKLEIQYALGILPYPTMQEKMISVNSIPEYSKLMAWNGRYAIYNVFEDAFLLDIQDNRTYEVGDYYGDPELAMIDKQETVAVVVGSEHLGVFDLVNKKLKITDIDIPDWIISLNQEGRRIEVICENDRRYVFEI